MSDLPLFTEMEAEAQRSGKLSGWLQKKKSGTSVMRVRQYNRRYFTLDFDHRVLFYAHEQSSRKVSVPIPFDAIMDVSMTPDPSSGAPQEGVPQRKLSNRFSLSRENSFGTSQPCITVRANGRFMELLCASLPEAIQWFQALKGAMLFDETGARIKRNEDPRENVTTTAEGSDGNERMEADHREEDEPLPTPPDGNSPRVEKKPGLDERPAQHDSDDEDGEATRPQAPRSMFDLNDEFEAEEQQRAKPEEVETVQETGHMIQAEDFGFEAGDDDSDTDSGVSNGESKEGGFPRSYHKVEENAYAGAKEGGAASSSSSPLHDTKPTAAGLSASAGDRHEGLSLKERMAALEFSDDEDDDEDDPLGLGSKRHTGSPSRASSSASPATSPLADKGVNMMSASGRTAGSEGFAFTDLTQARSSGGYASGHPPVARAPQSPTALSQQSPLQKLTEAKGQWTPGASSSSASPSPDKPWQASPGGGNDGLVEGRSEVKEQIIETPSVQSPGAAGGPATPLSAQGRNAEVSGTESVEKKKKKKKKEDKDDPDKPEKEKKKKKKSSMKTGDDEENPEKEKKKKKKASKTENDSPRKSKDSVTPTGGNPLTPTQIQNIPVAGSTH